MYHSLSSIPLSLTSNMTIYGNILSDTVGYLKSWLTFTNSTDFLCTLLTTSVPEKSLAGMSTGKSCTVLASVCLLASLFSFCSSQSSIASENFCKEEGLSDNLSCERKNGSRKCFARNELCNNSTFCKNGLDEGMSQIRLDCKFLAIRAI